jgi:hypothetical protein
MKRRDWKMIEANFDGEVKAVLEAGPEAAAWHGALEKQRAGIRAVHDPAVIQDAQFPAFMAGIREGMETPQPLFSRRRIYAAVSMAAAALLIALATFAVFTGSPEPVKANEVERVYTELEGATVGYDQEDGVTTLWVNISRDDVLQ